MILSVFKEFYNMQKNLFSSPLKPSITEKKYEKDQISDMKLNKTL